MASSAKETILSFQNFGNTCVNNLNLNVKKVMWLIKQEALILRKEQK